MTLRVGPTSLDRVDGERLQHRVSSLPLLSVEKVYLFKDDATQVCCVCVCVGVFIRTVLAVDVDAVECFVSIASKLGRNGVSAG